MNCSSPRERELLAQGWTRRALLDQPRLGEAVEQYQALGFEVRLEPVDPAACQDPDQCTVCLKDPAAARRLKVLYTRPAPGGRGVQPRRPTPSSKS
jgi:hypothetical protein